jgi:hypothetical protein
MKSLKTFVQFLHPLVNSSTTDCLWAMGLKCSPDFAQEVMGNIFRNDAEVEVYIDDIGIFLDFWEQHFCIVLQKPQENGFTVNPLKCECAVKETD